jgi:hypothetical protein
MITIIYGTNIAASRKYFADFKQNTPDALTFEGQKITMSDLTQAFESQGLFGGESQVFIEELLSKRKTSKELEQITSYLEKQSEQNTIVLWESKELTPKQISLFGKPTVKKFDIPKEVFAFLDNLLPGNAKQTITLFHNVLNAEEPEFVFFMIVRQFRMMLAILSEGEQQIDEIKRLTWQKSKLIKQASAFGKNKLLAHYSQLFIIESGIKTGQLPGNLEQSIDMFLLSL